MRICLGILLACLFSCSGEKVKSGSDKTSYAQIEILYSEEIADSLKGFPSEKEIMSMALNELLHKEVVRRAKMKGIGVSDIRENLIVENVSGTNIIRLRYYTNSRVTGIMILDTLINELRKLELRDAFRKNDSLVARYQNALDSIRSVIDSNKIELSPGAVIDEEKYLFYLQKLANAKIERAAIISNIKLLEQATFYQSGKRVY